jgi:hypothetical protein
VNDNWREDCPARGAGLHHAHWSDCHPSNVHPGTDVTHTYTQCCHCERFIVGAPQTTSTESPVDPPMQDHMYIPTLVGHCLRCRLSMAKHPAVVRQVEPETGNVPLEPQYASIGAQGPAWGKGRGDLTERQQTFLVGWLGWLQHNGGGR